MEHIKNFKKEHPVAFYVLILLAPIGILVFTLLWLRGGARSGLVSIEDIQEIGEKQNSTVKLEAEALAKQQMAEDLDKKRELLKEKQKATLRKLLEQRKLNAKISGDVCAIKNWETLDGEVDKM
jgi:hypothetical protein